MRSIKIGTTIAVLSVIFALAYNTHFGWNELHESEAERLCDMLYEMGMTVAVIFWISPTFGVYFDFIESREKRKSLKIDHIITTGDVYYFTFEGDNKGSTKAQFGCKIELMDGGICRISYDDISFDLYPSSIQYIKYE